MPDPLGPGSALNAVTTRPALTTTYGDVPTWLQPCSGGLQNGTQLTADMFNNWLAQFRAAFAASAITIDSADDMLWRAILAAGIPYATDTSETANAIVATFSPPINVIGTPKLLAIRVANTVTGPTEVTANETATTPAVRNDGSQTAFAGGEIVAGQIGLFFYNGTNYVLLNYHAPTSQKAGLYSNKLGVTTSNTVRTWTLSTLVVSDGTNSTQLANVNVTINSALSGAGGLDTGTLAANTVYYEHVIYNPTTGTAAGLMSLSRTAPTLPSGYTQFARVGADAITDGSNNFYRLMRKGDDAWYVNTPSTNTAILPILAHGVIGGLTSGSGATGPSSGYHYNNPLGFATVSISAFVPASATKLTMLIDNDYDGGSSDLSNMYIAPNPNYGGFISTNPAPIFIGGSGSYYFDYTGVQTLFLESANIYVVILEAYGSIQVYGYHDPI